MKRQNTKYTRSPGKVEVPDFPEVLSQQSGLFPMPVIFDMTIGEEVGLYWIDPTPFVHKLAALRPFQLFVHTGLYHSIHGPLMWLLFYVPNPEPEPQPFASTECHINPCSPTQIATWRRLANQSHWHLTLLGSGNEVADFFEFENIFGLDDALDMMEQTYHDVSVADFMAAKQEFWNKFTMDDLYRLVKS